ncbi:MAG: response regulator [Candidatus Margulisbacteria bacterium]|nr:response regulator [Candidatus Margulisiibacteriota bacterium]
MDILIIDDELISRKKLLEILKPFGNCIEISQSSEAIDVFEHSVRTNKNFNLVTVDIHMPHPNGMILVGKFREIEKKFNVHPEKKTKIFMVTSLNDKDHVLESLKRGSNDYILKPFTAEQVLDRMKLHGLMK